MPTVLKGTQLFPNSIFFDAVKSMITISRSSGFESCQTVITVNIFFPEASSHVSGALEVLVIILIERTYSICLDLKKMSRFR